MRLTALIAASAAALSLRAASQSADEMTEEQHKTPSPPSPPLPFAAPPNAPGETNRQFAARLKSASTHNPEG